MWPTVKNKKQFQFLKKNATFSLYFCFYLYHKKKERKIHI